jgi:hypothetical protein
MGTGSGYYAEKTVMAGAASTAACAISLYQQSAAYHPIRADYIALGWLAGLVLGITHLLIDTRVPVAWWIRVFKKSAQATEAGSIAIWLDQTLHLVCIAVWVSLLGS